MTQMTPQEIVHELDKHIVGQGKAKKAVAIALRNRWRRAQVEDPLRKLTELYESRDPLYREVADLIIDGGRTTAHNLLQLIVEKVEERWKL